MLEHRDCLNAIANVLKLVAVAHMIMCFLYISVLAVNRTNVHAT